MTGSADSCSAAFGVQRAAASTVVTVAGADEAVGWAAGCKGDVFEGEPSWVVWLAIMYPEEWGG